MEDSAIEIIELDVARGPGGFEVSILSPEPAYHADRMGMMTGFASREMTKKLLNDGRFRVYKERFGRRDYSMRLVCSEIVPDVKAARLDENIPFAKTTELLAAMTPMVATASSSLPIIGTLVNSFEPLTGLTLKSRKKEVTSFVRFDIQLLSKSGEVLHSRAYAAKFGSRMAERDSGTGPSEHKVLVTSSIQDATRVIVEDAFKDVKLVLDSYSG